MAVWFASEKAGRVAERVRVTDRKNLGRVPMVLPLLKLLGFRESVDAKAPMQRKHHLSHGQVMEALVCHLIDSLGQKRAPLYKMEQWSVAHEVSLGMLSHFRPVRVPKGWVELVPDEDFHPLEYESEKHRENRYWAAEL